MSFTNGMADPGAGPFIGIWQAAAVLLLLIACANIANLLLARGAERSQEYALRLALGASRTRLFGQTLLEGLMLAVLGVVLAMPLTALGLALSRSAIPASVLRFIPGWAYLHLDVRLFALTALLGTAAMLVFSVVPAMHAVRAQVSETLRQVGRSMTASRGRQWLRSSLAATQVALALALLFASSLALSAADRVVNGRLGFDKQNVLVGQLVLPARTYEDAEKRRRFITTVMDAVREIPAVTDVGFTSNIPAGFSNTGRQFWPEGVTMTEAEVRYANYRRSSNGYFSAMRIPLLQGRLFEDGDRLDTRPVAVVSSGLVSRYWPNDDPLGKRFKTAADGEWITVVGVVGDVVHNWFVQNADITFYRPLSQDAPYSVAFALRTVGEPASLAGDLRRAVAGADPDQPIASLMPLTSLVEERASGLTFIANSLGIVSAIALVLSVMGVYSLMAYLTTQRTQEIGVRMALGAGRWQVVRLTTMQALRITAAGTAIGAALAFALGRVMQSLLSGLVTTNIVLLGALVVVLGAAALLASYLPARRAAHVDPIAALRES
jgi:putative ABC transport system permease protein